MFIRKLQCSSARHRLILPFLLLLWSSFAPAQEEEPLTFAMKDADLTAVIQSVSEITGRNFIVDPRVKGRVTVVSSRPMAPDQIYEVFLSLLNVHGFTVIPGENVSKIVPVVNAKQDAIPTVEADNQAFADEYVTQVIEVKNVAVPQLVPILRPLLPQQGHLAAYPPSNVLIASGEAANVRRLVEIIRRIDVAGDEGIEIIPLKHASATEVVNVVKALAAASPQDQSPVTAQPTLVADERTNSILISGGKSKRLRIRTLVAHLDTPMETGGNTEVIYLKYANAEDLVEVLTGVSEKLAANGSTPAAGQAAQSADQVHIQADEATNALVISASPDVIRSLRAVVQKLDIRRAQVLVEAIIAEVSADTSKQLGIQWVANQPGGPVGVINFGGGNGIAGVLGAASSGATGALVSAIGDGATLAAGETDASGQGYAAILRALAGNANTNILSTPSLVSMDNEEAEIVVGRNVPFVTGSYTSTGGGSTPATPFQTIQRQDVGLTLRVRPQINEGNAVKLEISQEVSSLDPSTTAGASDLITNKRSLKTTVMVDDGAVVVLGGLIDDQLQESDQRVPLLGDIPVLGQLFRFSSTQKQKRNLMVFLHPVILRSEVEASAVSHEKYNYIRARQLDIRQQGVALMNEEVSPLLPEVDDLLLLPPPFDGAPAQSGSPALEQPASVAQ